MTRNAVTAVFFLAMAPLGLMETEVGSTGQRESKLQDNVFFAERKAQHVSGRT